MYVIKLGVLLILAGMAICVQYDPHLAEELYHYSRPSYCNAQNLPSWTCEACAIHPNIQELQVFFNSSHAGQGYCAYNPDDNIIILAVRGTDDTKNWLQDADILKTNYGPRGSQVHEGFLRVYEDLANNLLACAYTLSSNHPDAPIYITGHSLGAAVASFAAIDINNFVKPITAFYSFGQPRVGNAAFKSYIESTLSHVYLARITHLQMLTFMMSQDIFVHLPTKTLGFEHYGHEVHYNSDSSVFSVFGNTEDDKGANQFFWPWQWTTKDHLFYFQECAGCTSVACQKYT